MFVINTLLERVKMENNITENNTTSLTDIHKVVYNFTNLELSSIFVYKDILSKIHTLISKETVISPEKEMFIRTLQKIENDLQIWESLKQYTFQDNNTYNFISVSDEQTLNDEKNSVDAALYKIKSTVSLAN